MSQISDFKEFIAKKKPHTISFLSENQESYAAASPCWQQLSFTNMLISENPSTILLTNGESSMRLNMIKSIEYDENITPIGVLIQVVCGARGVKKKFTLVAS